MLRNIAFDFLKNDKYYNICSETRLTENVFLQILARTLTLTLRIVCTNVDQS